MKMLLGGFYYKGIDRVQFDALEFPTENQLLEMLNLLVEKSGIIGLEQVALNEFGNNELSLYSENGNYLVMYGTYDEDGDYLVSSLNNSSVKHEMLNVLGEPFPACSVIDDFEVVKEVFIEFLLTGEPSCKLVN